MAQRKPDDTQILADVVDQLSSNTSGDQVSVGDVLDAFEDRSIGALCAIIGVIAATPLVGAIPGVSILTGMLVILIASQYVAGRDSPWIPAFLRARSIARDTLKEGMKQIRPYAVWVDQYIKPRVSWIIAGRVQRRVAAVAMCLLALTMFPLALVPWGVQAPATAIVMLGVAMIGRDGLFALIGYVLSVLTIFVMIYFWDSVSAFLVWLGAG
ncbi:MAG: exopolysaccharide biosynthesis protein [Alphaproteobacteria bacterium]|nr:exopolysaccharide biosynthesis protein [Alphaproteobacteria bacterium]